MKEKKKEPPKKQKAYYNEQLKVKFASRKGAECARKAGYSSKWARQTALKLNSDSAIKTAIQEALDGADLTIDNMAKETKRLALDCKHPFAPNMPDNEVRRRTLEMGFKLHDVFPSQKIDINKTTARYDMTPQDVKRLRDYKAEQIIDAEIIEEDGIESF